jgi:hypothetical protein
VADLVYVSICVALYTLIFIFDIIPQIKEKRKKSLAVYLPVFFLTLAVNILYGLGFDIPSPAVPIKDLVSRIFGLS